MHIGVVHSYLSQVCINTCIVADARTVSDSQDLHPLPSYGLLSGLQPKVHRRCTSSRSTPMQLRTKVIVHSITTYECFFHVAPSFKHHLSLCIMLCCSKSPFFSISVLFNWLNFDNHLTKIIWLSLERKLQTVAKVTQEECIPKAAWNTHDADNL